MEMARGLVPEWILVQTVPPSREQELICYFKVGGFGGWLGYGIPFFSHLPLAICDCFRLLRVNQLLDRLYLKISTNLLRQQVVDFPMSRNRRTPITSTIAPPGMTTAFTDHYTSSTSKVFQQFNSFHAMTTFSSW